MRSENPYVIVTLAFLTLAAVVLLLGFELPPDHNFQSYLCVGEDCTVQQWLSALSGWVAGGVAALTVVPLWRQLREARRQTSFIVGDDLPSLELSPSGWAESGKFRVVNWNRRPFYICELRWQAAIPLEAFEYVSIDTKIFSDVSTDGHLKRRIVIGGWENRSAPPPSLEAEFGFVEPDEDDGRAGESPAARLEIVGYLSGEVRKMVRLSATAPIAEVRLDA